MIPKDRVLFPFAVTTTTLDGLFGSQPNFFIKGLVMILVAAPLSIMAVTAIPFILKTHLAAVVLSSSLPAKLASASWSSFSLVLWMAFFIPDRYLGIKCIACPTVMPLGMSDR